MIFEDADILALTSRPASPARAGEARSVPLDEPWAFAKSSGNRPRLVHRLDRDTSGVSLTARTKPRGGFLGKAMMGRSVRKTYLAIVTPGPPQSAAGVIETPCAGMRRGARLHARLRRRPPRRRERVDRYRTLAANEARRWSSSPADRTDAPAARPPGVDRPPDRRRTGTAGR